MAAVRQTNRFRFADDIDTMQHIKLEHPHTSVAGGQNRDFEHR
jgi:hypothetical protein